MHKGDSERLKIALDDMTEVYGIKPVSDRALAVWFETLKDLEIQAVLNAVYDWIKTKPKAAAPSDIRGLASAWLSRQLEAESARNNGEAPEDFRQTIQREADPTVIRALDRWRADMQEALRYLNRDTYWQDALIAAYRSGKIINVQMEAVRTLCHGEPSDERIERAKRVVARQIAREKSILKPVMAYLSEERGMR